MAYIERRKLTRTDASGRGRGPRFVTRCAIATGRASRIVETKRRLVDAERRRAEIETELAGGSWRDPRRGQIRLSAWAADWVQLGTIVRATTRSRLDTTMRVQVLPRVRGDSADQDHERGCTPVGGGAPRDGPVACVGAQGGVRIADSVWRLRLTITVWRVRPGIECPASVGEVEATAVSVSNGGGAAGWRDAGPVPGAGVGGCLRRTPVG